MQQDSTSNNQAGSVIYCGFCSEILAGPLPEALVSGCSNPGCLVHGLSLGFVHDCPSCDRTTAWRNPSDANTQKCWVCGEVLPVDTNRYRDV